MSNQQINIAEIIFEEVGYSLDIEPTELYTTLDSLKEIDRSVYFAVEAAVTRYANDVRRLAFMAGWQLAKQ